MDSRPLPTTVTEVLEQITDAARSILESLQQKHGSVPLPGLSRDNDDMDQYVLAALVAGMARLLADTNEMVMALRAAQNGEATVPAGDEERATSPDDVVRRLLGRSNVGFFG